MFIGAAPASTGGGIRVTTLAILLATVEAVLKIFVYKHINVIVKLKFFFHNINLSEFHSLGEFFPYRRVFSLNADLTDLKKLGSLIPMNTLDMVTVNPRSLLNRIIRTPF